MSHFVQTSEILGPGLTEIRLSKEGTEKINEEEAVLSWALFGCRPEGTRPHSFRLSYATHPLKTHPVLHEIICAQVDHFLVTLILKDLL